MGASTEERQHTDPLNHHKVPQTYLKGFDAGQGIIVYDGPGASDLQRLIEQVKSPRVETRVKKLAAEIDYYTRETPSGPDYSFETMLSRFENEYPRVMKAVRSGSALTDEQLGMLALLAALQDARVRRMDLVGPLAQVREHARLLYKQHRPEFSEYEIEAATDAVMRRDMVNEDIPSPKNISLSAVPLHIDFAFNVFRFMYKCVVKSDAQDFVTSDGPVTWLDPAQFPEHPWRHFRLSGFMEVTFPLNRRHCLVMAWHPMKQRYVADEATVGAINARTASSSRRHIFATNTGAERDRHINGRDFTNMQSWMGAPISSIFIDETAQLSDADAANYQRCLMKLGLEWEYARSENARLAPRFKAVSEQFLEKASDGAN